MSKKAQEAAKYEAAMKQAADDAQRLFRQHERERRAAEAVEKSKRDDELFQKTREQERLQQEKQQYEVASVELAHVKELALVERAKHEKWGRIMEVSWLPSVNSESEIQSFLQQWREDQSETKAVAPTDVKVDMRCTVASHILTVEQMRFIRDDTCLAATWRRKIADDSLEMCVKGFELTEALWKDADRAWVNRDAARLAFQRANLIAVYDQILASVDDVTCDVLQYLDVFIEQEEETVLKKVPKRHPVMKYGLWAQNRVASAHKVAATVSSIRYPGIGVYIDPRDKQTIKLPRHLGIAKDNVAIRVVQLSFDPFSVRSNPKVGQEYYALDCVIIVERMLYPERSKKVDNWSSRIEKGDSRVLKKLEYPPRTTDEKEQVKQDEYAVKITFQVPRSIAIRHRTPVIGKWNEQALRWDPCGTCTWDPDAGDANDEKDVGDDDEREDPKRKASFLTSDLTTMAVIQEKGFDVPYEQWQLYPLNDDEVLFVIEGRRRGESSDREIKILVRDNLCKLLAPEERELDHLRTNWLSPPTLLRLLARAGYNFLLQDADADFLHNVLPKTEALEKKGYYDISLFCTMHAFASTKHNKMGEDKDMGLFRFSKAQRAEDCEEPFYVDADTDDKWFSVRYQKERCVLANFKESDDDADLSSAPGEETHLNLYMLLQKKFDADMIAMRTQHANHLLQSAVCQLLSLTRPFTWG